ncbi:MAG TPA: phosphohydrolase [Myxococcales bacterium]|jgi:response regulator RpfG family c-di-GMP phosphodiesterase
MVFSLSGTVLSKDLFAADGRLVAGRGEIVDLECLRHVSSLAPRGLRERPLFETSLAEPVLEAFDAEPLEHLVGIAERRKQVADVMADVRFPQQVWDEVEALRKDDAVRFQHAVWTAIVSARLFRMALGAAPGLSKLVGGALTHDLGMRVAGSRLRHKREHLSRSEALAIEDHPLVGALLLASVLGDAPAVHFALLHHTRAGRGYPRVQGTPPLRGLDLVTVASAFSALIAPRSFREQPFSPRGAIDQLSEDAEAGHFDARAVKLLIHCMRGGAGTVSAVQLPKQLTGFRPPKNCHGVQPDSRLSA